MTDIDFVFFDAGGGHRSAATALKTVCEQQGRPWRIRLLNLQEVLDELDVFRKITRVRLEDLYNRLLAGGWTYGSEYLLMGVHGVIRLYHSAQVRLLTQFWNQNRPAMVVSLVPNFNRAMFQAIQRVDPNIPYVTIITDFADFPPHFWMERQDQHMVCGTERAVQQAQQMQYDPSKIYATSGMILRPSFYEPCHLDVPQERRKLGLDPNRPTGLMLFGGQGSAVMEKITSRLQTATSDLQVIAICGRNERLGERLRAKQTRYPLHVVGFTAEVQRYMALSDFFIGKPGPGSISEAVCMKLPVIIERNSWTLPQERYNADWVLEKQAGLVVQSFDEIDKAVDKLLEPSLLGKLRANVTGIQNRAVFEIADILDGILNRRPATSVA